MKIKDLRLLSSEELEKKEVEFKKDLFALNYQRKLGNVEKPSRFGHLRRDIARVQTIIKERDLKHD
ncbi:MAG: 50S ribosomal protein L29 [Candidatus Omnitrophica bacterium]|nr:50S ribosomal protein L29 [Candidatus Omnitrophota bacterium]